MKISHTLFATLLTLGGTLSAGAQVNFDDYFLPKSMRLDYYHAGSVDTEHYYVDEVIEEPYWAGNKNYLVEPRNIGNHLFKVIDKATGKVIYSRGFNSLFNEWQTTPEAKHTPKAMPEGVVFPFPKKDVTVEIYTRENRTGKLHLKFSYDIDVESYFIRKMIPTFDTMEILCTGDPEKRVDIVILPDGYTEAEREKFEKDCHTFAEGVLAYSPYTENREKFNFRAVWTPSHDSGNSIPGKREWKHTALKTHFYTFNSERYQMTEDFQTLLDAAAHVPYEMIYILSNTSKYGGGGIYNFYGISASDIPGASTRKTYSHEMGHLLVGLADEYVGGVEMSDLYFTDVEPWEANITTLTALEKKEWKKLLGNAPVPTPVKETPWELNPQNPDSPDFNPEKPWPLGVYEGGGYLQKGVYRPWPNCMMNWFHRIDEYCPVCKQAIQETIDLYTK